MERKQASLETHTDAQGRALLPTCSCWFSLVLSAVPGNQASAPLILMLTVQDK